MVLPGTLELPTYLAGPCRPTSSIGLELFSYLENSLDMLYGDFLLACYGKSSAFTHIFPNLAPVKALILADFLQFLENMIDLGLLKLLLRQEYHPYSKPIVCTRIITRIVI